MHLIKKVWDYQPDISVRNTVKSRAIRGVVWLLALMLCFTLISRFTSSMTIPIVSVERPRRSSITHTVNIDGVLETVSDVPIITTSDVLVRELYVKPGDIVEEGDLLFLYDISNFNQNISKLQVEISKLRAELAEIQDRALLAEEQRGLDRERAEENFNMTVELSEFAVFEAVEAVRQAREALRKYDGIRYSDYDDYEFTESEYNSLRAALRERTIAYDRALVMLEHAKTQAQRDIDDIDKPKIDISEEVKNMDISLKQIELNELNRAVANRGQVLAPSSGVITKVNISPGGRTGNQAAIYMNNSDTISFVANINKDDRKHVNQGNIINITISGENRPLENIYINSIIPMEDNPSMYRLTAEIPIGDYLPGISGAAQVTQRSQVYDTCIPLSALYLSGEQYYVLAVREIETTLGTEYIAEKVDVTLHEKNATLAAISGAFSTQTRLIHNSNKTIKDGDKVRISE